jgi:hypothetical protein
MISTTPAFALPISSNVLSPAAHHPSCMVINLVMVGPAIKHVRRVWNKVQDK